MNYIYEQAITTSSVVNLMCEGVRVVELVD